MRAEDTLQMMMDFGPDFFPTRKHCLNYLFCTIGNGFKWVGGALEDPEDYLSNHYRPIEPIVRATGLHEKQWLSEAAYYQKTKQKFPDLFIPPKYIFTWSTISKEHSHLVNYPEDIQTDWYDLIQECLILLKEDGIEVPTNE